MSRTQRTGALDRSGRRPGRVGLLCDGYQRRADFEVSEEVSRTEFAVVFASKARKAARRYVTEYENGQPTGWNDFHRPWDSRRRLSEYRGEREAWAEALDLLWTFSRGEFVDADALREALTRKSQRAYEQTREADRYSRFWFACNERESVFCKASAIVLEQSGIEQYSERELDLLRKEYHRGSDFDGE